MKNFNLYILKHNLYNLTQPSLIPIGASHQSTTSYPQGTYNEKLTNKPNSQAQLTFNIATTYNGKHNRNADFMVNGQRLRIVFDNDKETCQDFFITKVAPTVSQNNTILAVTATDWFSYQLSHTATGLNYDTLDNGGVKTIQELVGDIFRTSHVTAWQISQELVNEKVPRFYEKENKIHPMKISFAVNGSNCYNALVEIAKKFDATIVPHYYWSGQGGYVDFINNNDFESNIYQLSPTVNINNFGVSQQSNNLCTLMYVKGSTDAYGKDVTLTPEMQGAFKYWLLEHMTYDDDAKPTCMEHNYPILITKSYNSTQMRYIYKKYKNSLYKTESGTETNTLHRELWRNSNNENTYAGLFKKYDEKEDVKFSIKLPTSTEWTLKVDGVDFEIDNAAVIEMNEQLEKIIEISIPATLIKKTGEATTIQVYIGSTPLDLASIDIVTSSWTIDNSDLSIIYVWEAQDTMLDIYKLFTQDWKSCSQTSDAGLYAFKSLDASNMTLTMVYNYCKYIDNQVPAAGNFLYDFSYFLKERLITPVELYGLEYILSHDVRNLNILITIYSELYYELLYQFNSRLATIKTYLSTFLAELDTHKECVNRDNSTSGYPSTVMPTDDVIKNIVKTSSTELIPFYQSELSLDNLGIDVQFYTDTCNNNLIEISANILREGLTTDFVRNCVILYGGDFFRNITSWLDSNEEFAIFKNETATFFNYLYEYNLLLGRTGCEKGIHQELEETEVYSVGRSIEADRILAKAELIRKQASYWYDKQNKIYMEKPESVTEVFYHPNYREVFINFIKEFVTNTGSPYYAFVQQAAEGFNLVNYYKNLLSQKDSLWKEIFARYGEYVLESTYNDSTELTSSGLYNAAILNFTKANRPIYNYTVTSIDASQLINTGTENIQVGDRISVHHPAVFPKPVYNKTYITILNEEVDNTFKYRIPPKGSSITSINLTRYNLVEADENANIYDQILGNSYGPNTGKIISSDMDNFTITVEWDQDWSVFGIDSLSVINYGTKIFCGDYSGVAQLRKFSYTTPSGSETINNPYKAGEWVANGALVSGSNRGLKVYQVVDEFNNLPWTDAVKKMHRVDVYFGTDTTGEILDLSLIDDGSLYVAGGKFYQKYSEQALDAEGNLAFDEDDKPIMEHKGQEVVSYPVYADFVYEPDELLLTITGVTYGLRENTTQLQVQDNSLINSLVDKLLYSVRFS